jgi:hypothetical protein
VKKGVKTIGNPKENYEWLIAFYDFWIREDCLSQKNSFAEIGCYGGYERPNSDICPDVKTFLAGSRKFQVSELEVYQVPERKL